MDKTRPHMVNSAASPIVEQHDYLQVNNLRYFLSRVALILGAILFHCEAFMCLGAYLLLFRFR